MRRRKQLQRCRDLRLCRLQTARGRLLARPEAPPLSLLNPAKARLDAVYLRLGGLDLCERNR